MNDDVNPDDLGDIEALLAELDVADLEPLTPPESVWTGIERGVASDSVGPLVRHRRHRFTWALASAAAVAAVVAGAILITGNRTADEQVVSTAALTFDPAAFDPRGAGAAADAELVDRDGTYAIRLTGTSFPELTDDDLELWLIEPDDQGNPVDVVPVSLIDAAGGGLYEVPRDIDPATHFVVDISIEPRDGDATHSGQSILRGALDPG